MSTAMTLESLAEALADGRLTPDALMAETLERARASDSVFTVLLEHEAVTAAAAATARRRCGEARSRYDGIPFAVKDLFDIAGTTTTAGSATLVSAPAAARDAPIIARLRAAGLIPIGKTNLSEFAFSGLGINPHFGTPTARARPDRAPGGSSSGSAVAVADGIVAIALGTDTAGSIRVPAAFNGLVGYRPSIGRYEPAGIFPLAASFDVPGPIANSVEDCLTLDRLMGGGAMSPGADAAPTLVVDEWLLTAPELDPDNRSAVLGFAELAASTGAYVRACAVAAIRKAGEALRDVGWVGGAQAAALHAARLASPERGSIDRRVVARLDRAAAMSPRDVQALRLLGDQLAAEITEELAGGILVTPTIFVRPPLLAPLLADDELFARTNLESLFVTMIGSYLRMPGISIPTGTASDGLPTSVLLSTGAGDDARLLAAARWVTSSLTTLQC